MFGIASWLAGHDQLGTFAKFNYRGESGYGTGLGGFCSLVVTIITIMFTFTVIYPWVTSPSYNQSATTVYLGAGGVVPDPYEIEVGEFLPTYWIITNDDDHTHNGKDYFNYYYRSFDFALPEAERYV